jgi:hypothetical protein
MADRGKRGHTKPTFPQTCLQHETRMATWKAKLERPRGLEPPPTAWQAVVLPLYYGRFAQLRQRLEASKTFIARSAAPEQACSSIQKRRDWLIYFEDAGSAHNRGFLLPFGKARRPLAIDVHASESLPVLVVDRHLPVPVFAPLVSAKAAAPFSLLFFHFGSPFGQRTIASFQVFAQVTPNRITARVLHPAPPVFHYGTAGSGWPR